MGSNMAPYIYMDVMVFISLTYIKLLQKLEEAADAMQKIAASGEKSVTAKKKQARHRSRKKLLLVTCHTSQKDGLVEC
jgi:ribosomal protein S2